MRSDLEAVEQPAPRSARAEIHTVIVATSVAITAIMLCSIASLVLVYREVNEVTRTLGPASAANVAVLQAMTNAESGLRGFQLTGDSTFLEPYAAAVTPARDALTELDRLMGDDAQLADDVRAERQLVDTWLTTYAEPVAAGTLVSASEQAEAKTVFDEFRRANAVVTAVVGVRRDEARIRVTRIVEFGGLALIMLAVVGGWTGLRSALRSLRAIGPPLERLAGTVSQLESGREMRADPGLGVVEIRQVARAVNRLADVNQAQREQLAEELRLAATVRAVGLTIGTGLDLGSAVDDCLDPVTTGFQTAAMWIRAFEGEGELPGRGRGAFRPDDPRLVPTVALVDLARRVACEAWKRQVVVQVRPGTSRPEGILSAESIEMIMVFLEQVDAVDVLIVPLGAGRECLGYMVLTRSSAQPRWHRGEVDAALQVGRDIGRAILHARLYEKEQSLVEALTVVDAKKDALVSMVSHELRTPLTSILGHLELVREGALGDVPPAVDRSLAVIDRNTGRLTNLIEDLLLLSKIEEGTRVMTRERVDLDALVGDAVDTLDLYCQREEVHVALVATPHTTVEADAHELERVVNNLLTNAVKFSPRGATVDVAVRRTGERVELSVTDTGLGISAADQDQLFSRFFRSTNPAALQIPGTGLGLAIVKVIVERHGGQIHVRSTLGEGSRFVVDLPAAVRRP